MYVITLIFVSAGEEVFSNNNTVASRDHCTLTTMTKKCFVLDSGALFFLGVKCTKSEEGERDVTYFSVCCTLL